jgi:hypothetical protein
MLKDTCLVAHKERDQNPHKLDPEIPRIMAPELDCLRPGLGAR